MTNAIPFQSYLAMYPDKGLGGLLLQQHVQRWVVNKISIDLVGVLL